MRILKLILKFVGIGIVIFLIYIVLGCLNAARQGIFDQKDEDGGPSINETIQKVFNKGREVIANDTLVIDTLETQK
jgi:hypothetical protein